MKYKCLKCDNEFEATWEAICPKCKASGSDVVTLRKWQMAQPIVADED
jgi:Zn finger protein HypA/HybF involved in hydrogenase expression